MESSIKEFLKGKMTASRFENLHSELQISRRMLTFLLRDPGKLSSSQLFRLAELTGIEMTEFKQFIN